ncbi:MAG: pyrroloquinoline quinone-dependent dehydrogenase, partial [Gammaproteobacteria bacterium]
MVYSAIFRNISLGAAAFLMSCSPAGEDFADSALTTVNWDVYLGDNARSHYSPLTQINRDNVASLELAWVYDAGALRPGASTMHTSPLVIDGILYGLSPLLEAFAINGLSGQELWRFDPGESGAEQRGLMWWQEGSLRRLLYAAGNELIALDPDTGLPVSEFGNDGRVGLLPPGMAGPLTVTVPGVVYGNSVILGYSTSESANALPGMVRAFSVHSGEELWRFNTLPEPGQPGADTWARGSLATAGGANNWTGMALDEDRGMLFVPTGSATPDFYGGSRAGDNLYANSLLALDAGNGNYLWHFQAIRHDLWDRDLASPPTLVQLNRDGETIDAVAQTTKSGHLYLFRRDNGEPLYQISETATTPSDFPDEAV